jgi:hypothetical protein
MTRARSQNQLRTATCLPAQPASAPLHAPPPARQQRQLAGHPIDTQHQRRGQGSLQFESVSSPTAATSPVVPVTGRPTCLPKAVLLACWPASAGSGRIHPAGGQARERWPSDQVVVATVRSLIRQQSHRGSRRWLGRNLFADPAEDGVAAAAAAAAGGAESRRIRPADGRSLGRIAGRSTGSRQR